MEPTVEHRKHRRYLVHFKSIFSTDGVHIEEGLVLDLALDGTARLYHGETGTWYRFSITALPFPFLHPTG